MRSNLVRMAALCLCFVIGTGFARAEDPREGLYLTNGDSAVPAPVLGSTVEVKVTGIIARTKVTQIFKNPSKEWVEGIYIFPLPEDAAVDALRLKIGGRAIQGEIQEKKEARQTYEAAKQQGLKTALLEQQRPDVFTTAVASIGPGETVEVAIELQQTVRYAHGKFGLRFPMVVVPRGEPKKGTTGSSRLVLPPVLPRGSAPINPFVFHVDLNPGFPLSSVTSPTHKIAVAAGKNLRWAVDLEDGVAPADGDLALEWAPAVGREPRAVYYSEEVDGERYALLMVLPPDAPDAADSRLPRETIFIIDTSGSMSGESIVQAREALLFGLGKLQPSDWFNVIAFNTSANAVFPSTVPASPDALDRARRFIAGLNAGGGTQMLPALQMALAKPPPAGLVPQLIFATDGELYDQSDVVQRIHTSLGDRRLFPIAIGSAPNVALLRQLASLGRGSFTQISNLGKVASEMSALFAQLESPMLQQIDVQWSDPSTEAWPERVPDLYLGDPLVVTARMGADGPVTVSGQRRGAAWEDSFPAAAEVKGAGIDKLWARSKIQGLMDSLQQGADPQEVRRAVTALGLRHHLVTAYTSLVAVDVTPTAPADVEPVKRIVPVNPPRGSTTVDVDVAGDAVTEEIVVTADSPMLDQRRLSVAATISQTELEKIPTARDPWAVLQSTPGVLTDRVDVGGNENGQPLGYVGPGSGLGQAAWSMDGLVVTDMVALGSSPGYYDFDSFAEVAVTTGGSDATLATGGVVLDVVTKHGTNEWRGSGHFLLAGDRLQSQEDRGGSQIAADRLDKAVDHGVEVGGPIAKDRLWIWGSYGKQKIDLLPLGELRDTTTLEEWNAKLNAQVTVANSATLFAWNSKKVETGRNAGPLRPQETSWDQSAFGSRPTAWKVEDTQIFGSNLFVTGSYSRAAAGVALVPEGGDARPYRDRDLQWHDSFVLQRSERAQEQGALSGSFVFNSNRDRVSHELKYGLGYRAAESSSLLRWPGGGSELVIAGPTPADDVSLLLLSRDAAPRIKTDYANAFLQDVFNLGRLTANFGLRWDRQGGSNEASAVGANPVAPELLPAAAYAGEDAGFTWSDVTPRLGMTYALDTERKTLLRASYSRFADPLSVDTAGWLNPLRQAGYRSFQTGDGGRPTLETLSPNVNPLTRQLLQSFAVDPDLRAPLTDELLLSAERALRFDFVVKLGLTYRQYHDSLEAERLVFDTDDPFAPEFLGSVGRVHRRGDYVERTLTATTPDGRAQTVHYWELAPGLSTRNGFRLENGDREQQFRGASLTLDKRRWHHWMLRGNVSWQDWTWQIPDSENEDPTDTVLGGIVDGTEVLQGAGTVSGPKGNVYINGRWSYNLAGLVEIASERPWGFNVAANLTGRQGYPLRWVQRIPRQTIVDDSGSGIDVPLWTDPGALRYPDVHVVDLRVEKELTFRDFGLTLGVDLFNALNKSYVLQRQGVLGRDNSGHVLEVLSPRVLRAGARMTFR